jgi:hypothetical protein
MELISGADKPCAGGRSFVEGPYVEADRRGIKVWLTNARDEGQSPRSIAELKAAAAGNAPTLDFLFPGVWLVDIGPRLKNFIAFVPINEQRPRYYLRVYHRIRNPFIAKLFEALMGVTPLCTGAEAVPPGIPSRPISGSWLS